MIFVTLGSQKFQFNRLLAELDRLIETGVIQEEVMAQIGASTYEPRNYRFMKFIDRDRFSAFLSEADVVITHGGTGVIIEAVKKGKKVIAVPRLAKYGEHVDDHQLQLLHQFDELGMICACYDIDRLEDCVKGIKERSFRPYTSNTHVIIQSIEEFLSSIHE